MNTLKIYGALICGFAIALLSDHLFRIEGGGEISSTAQWFYLNFWIWDGSDSLLSGIFVGAPLGYLIGGILCKVAVTYD